MTFEEIRAYCLGKKGTKETFPFDDTTLVFKVSDKMFALIGLNADQLRINLKCDPDFAVILRQKYPAVQPGYHMNKRHWNTVTIDGTIPDDEILFFVDESYNLVVRGMKKSDREDLGR